MIMMTTTTGGVEMSAKPESKYERLRRIGIGSYGVVFKCVNRQSGQIVAIKRYSENDTDPIIRKIAMREVRMLRQLKHPNLINLIEVFRRKRRLHLVFDYCELTVLDVIEKYSNNCPLNLIKKIIWQTVNGINYCHLNNCIHRDIKPENILINQSGVVKLCDFGFARNLIINKSKQINVFNGESFKSTPSSNVQINMTTQYPQLASSLIPPGKLQIIESVGGCGVAERQALTEYVATRWYRAPELLIGEIYYDFKIDIWAVGCVTAELMRGEPIWPGKTDVDQLCIIKSSLGQLTPSQTQTLLTQSIYDQATIEKILVQGSSSSDRIERKVPGLRVGQGGVDFVMACLQMDPQRRPASEDLLRHPYIQSVKMSQFVISQQSHSNQILNNNSNSQQVVVIAASGAKQQHQHQQTMATNDTMTGGQDQNINPISHRLTFSNQNAGNSKSNSQMLFGATSTNASTNGSTPTTTTTTITTTATSTTATIKQNNTNNIRQQVSKRKQTTFNGHPNEVAHINGIIGGTSSTITSINTQPTSKVLQVKSYPTEGSLSRSQISLASSTINGNNNPDISAPSSNSTYQQLDQSHLKLAKRSTNKQGINNNNIKKQTPRKHSNASSRQMQQTMGPNAGGKSPA